MIKTFKIFITEAEKLSDDVHKKITNHAHKAFIEADPDLPRQGNYKFASAVDHVADILHDKFHKEHPEALSHFQKIAKKVVSEYEDNDTARSRYNEGKAKYAVKPKPAPKPLVASKPKPRKGIGSY